jgi:hypothetical protein
MIGADALPSWQKRLHLVPFVVAGFQAIRAARFLPMPVRTERQQKRPGSPSDGGSDHARLHSDLDIDTAIIALGHEPRGGLIVLPDVFTFALRPPIISTAARYNVVVVYPTPAFARDGGLLAYYGADQAAPRRPAIYV